MIRKSDESSTLQCHRLTAYATKEGVRSETFAYFKIVQSSVRFSGYEKTLRLLWIPLFSEDGFHNYRGNGTGCPLSTD